jgi:hypothetical protein
MEQHRPIAQRLLVCVPIAAFLTLTACGQTPHAATDVSAVPPPTSARGTSTGSTNPATPPAATPDVGSGTPSGTPSGAPDGTTGSR